ncbi:MAG: trehalase family glycosidase [Verrucomicrobiae bacterium]|nr:trehalase family glycosidase [Verrucomicrobiae bacterium]
MKQTNEFQLVHKHIQSIMPKIECPAQDKIPHPYLMVAYGIAYGGTIFGWDHHHMAMRFAHAGQPRYLRHLADNLLHFQHPDGFTPNCVHPVTGASLTPKFHAQPFLMQGAWMYAARTGDLEWLRRRFEQLKKYLSFYESCHAAPHGLFRWPLSWMSGFDNDVATSFFQQGTTIPADLSAWIYLEYRAASLLAAQLGQKRDSALYRKKAAALRSAINRVLWNEKAQSYAAYNLCEGDSQFRLQDLNLDGEIGAYSFQTCSNLIPLYAGVTDEKKAKAMIKRYVWNEKHFLSPCGIRSLSKSSEYYNNAVWGNPPRFDDPSRLTNSNWQGPVWVPLNYFMFHALRRYGFKNEARDLAARTIHTLAGSLKKIGSFTENFHAETGEPLYAQKFASWNILADIMLEEMAPGKWIMDKLAG